MTIDSKDFVAVVIAAVGGVLSLLVGGYVTFMRVLIHQWHTTNENNIKRMQDDISILRTSVNLKLDSYENRIRTGELDAAKISTAYDSLTPMISDMKADIKDMKARLDTIISQAGKVRLACSSFKTS